MNKLLHQTVQSGGKETEIVIEVEDNGYSLSAAEAYGETRGIVNDTFDKAMALIRVSAEQVASTVQAVAEASRPSEVEVCFGVKMDGESGIAFLAKTGVEAQLQVKLKWSEAKKE